ncbi:MAG: transposase [Desulfobaccales bacterium]
MYRAFVPGGTFFFTVTLLERRRQLLTENIDNLQEVFTAIRRRRPFTIEAIVILPDHLHCIWTLPSGDADFSARWHDIKARFAAQISGGERLSPRRLQKGERGVWQRRFWEHLIRDEGDYERHLDYILYHPVKHGQVARVADWPYLSFHRFVEGGLYNLEWGAEDNVRSLEME